MVSVSGPDVMRTGFEPHHKRANSHGYVAAQCSVTTGEVHQVCFLSSRSIRSSSSQARTR